MHKDIKKLNKEDPPPKGCKHPAYEVVKICNRENEWCASYLLNGDWNMCVITFPSEKAALRYILDKVYYGD